MLTRVVIVEKRPVGPIFKNYLKFSGHNLNFCEIFW